MLTNEMSRRPFVVPIIIFLNIAVYLFWQMSGEAGVTWMIQNFMVSWSNLMEGRFWTLLTAAFSHNLGLHIFLNMFVLFSFGTELEMKMGSWSFLKFYLTAAIISSFAHAYVSAQLLGQPDMYALGASGAVSGVILVFSLLNPRVRVLLLGIIPVPALIGALLFIGLDIWGLMAQTNGGGLPIGHGAHLGGAAVGIIYYFLFARKRFI